ncbi:MAG TPA: hypothetical protein VJV04_10090 [Nitrospiraceae bacterium]|nr:hypothetical protein [Nitrospiraceae bacterium]
MSLHRRTLLILIALGVGGGTGLVSAQPSQTIPGPSVPGTANPNNAVGPQGISPPVSGNFGVTPLPGTTMTPGYMPGAKPPGVGGGAGPGVSSGAPFSGTGYGTNSLGRTSPDTGASVPSTPSIGANNSSLGSGPGAGSPGPSVGTTPSSGAMAPGAGAAGGR